MRKIEAKQVVIFVIVFGILGIIICSTSSRGPKQAISSSRQQASTYSSQEIQSQQQSEREKQQRLELERLANARRLAEEAAAQHARYLARYLNKGITRKPGVQMLAIVTASENGKLNSTISTVLAQHFSSETVETISSLFTPEFISDGIFAKAFDGSTDSFNDLELAHSLDAVLLARQTIEYSQDPSLQNVITANMQLQVMISSIVTRGQSQTWTFTANGAGFTKQAARQLAEERLIKQITKDTKMSM
jgi:hypothetical protein